MKYSELLIPTLREAPSDAEVISHQLMLRAGYIRKLASGVYTYLSLCLRVLRKIEAIVRDEMEKGGAHELLLPIVMPAELWQSSGRWDFYGSELLRFKDRHGRDFCVGPTHEEAITSLFSNEVNSYKDLPKNCYQIQTKFRDEVRPRFGLMRGREFIMKDAYSFDRDEEASFVSYDKMYNAYKNIFTRCGLEFRPVEATTGNIGGTRSHEFQVLAETGEDEILSCNSCDYAANIELAQSARNDKLNPSNEKAKFEKLATPNLKTAEEVMTVWNKPIEKFTKTLIFETDQGPVAAMVRADHEVKSAKLQSVIGCEWCYLAEDETVEKVTAAPTGFAGPINLNIPVYVDYDILEMTDFLVGANEKDLHFINVNLADFKVEKFADLRSAKAGEACLRCATGKLESFRGIEVGQVFYLGTKYSKAMKAEYLDENGRAQNMVMGCYGIGIGRTAAAAVEQNHDERGIVWPLPIAPFQVEIIPLAIDGEVMDAATLLYQNLQANGVEVLLDDRKARAGVKFADADLIGIPYQIIIGAKTLESGAVEFKERKSGKVDKVPLEDACHRFMTIMQANAQ